MPSKAKVSSITKGKIDYTILPFVKYQSDLSRAVVNQFDYVINGTSKDIEYDYHLPANKALNFD